MASRSRPPKAEWTMATAQSRMGACYRGHRGAFSGHLQNVGARNEQSRMMSGVDALADESYNPGWLIEASVVVTARAA